MKRVQIALFLLLLLAASRAAAEVYRYVDENGVLSFTDDLSRVPSDQRPKVDAVELSPGPALSVPPERSAFERWRDHPAVKPAAAVVIGVTLVLIARTFLGGAVLRYLASAVLASAAGAALYLLSLSGGCGATDIRDVVPKTDPLRHAQEQADRFEQRNARQERMIDEQTREPRRATNP